jgi:CDK-activating kinase assembly factor MAT1
MTFIPQTFEDLVVEKEVAIRRKLAKESVACVYCPSVTLTLCPHPGSTNAEKIFRISVPITITCKKWKISVSRHLFAPPPFTYRLNLSKNTKRAAFNLINEIDIPETQMRIVAYRKENAALTELNQQRDEAYAQALKEQEEAERRERQLRAEELRRAEEEERDAREGERRALIDNLESSDADAARVVADARAEALRRAAARTAAAHEAVARHQHQRGGEKGSAAHVLRSRAAQSAVVPDVPHVPLADACYAYEDLYALRSAYFDPASDAVRRDKEGIMRAGGYRIEEAWERALRYAVAGLDIAPPGDAPLPHPQEAVNSRLEADVAMASVS